MLRLVLAAFAAMIVAGCSTAGPAVDCDSPCDPVAMAAPVGDGTAAAAAARGGQTATNQPMMQDHGRVQPYTVVGRGSGPTNSVQSNVDTRALAGAPSVNQGLVLPTGAKAEANGGAPVNPAVEEIRTEIRTLRDRAQMAFNMGNMPLYEQVSAQLKDAYDRLQTSMASVNYGTVNNNYHFDGARIVQSVANGASSGDSPTQAIDPEAARAIGENTARAVEATMGGEDAPPAGAAPVAPAGEGN